MKWKTLGNILKYYATKTTYTTTVVWKVDIFSKLTFREINTVSGKLSQNCLPAF